MLYHLYELRQAALAPLRIAVETTEELFRNPFFPPAHTPFGRAVVAGCEVAERITRRYAKPEFAIDQVMIDGVSVPVSEEPVLAHRFCDLLHFRKRGRFNDPKVLLVAPLSGHHATLLRGTLRRLLVDHDVYVTDWIDARDVALTAGTFDLDTYIDYVIEFLRMLGPEVHVIAVCQPSVPVLAAVSVLAATNPAAQPRSMTLMGGPIDTRIDPTPVNRMIADKPLSWFEHAVTSRVPMNHPGFMRRVYPGFMQLTGFMTMNLDRHVNAHMDLFNHLIEGDGDSAEAHRQFYDEYMSVMDLPAEYYLQTLKTVFMDHALPEGTMTWRDVPVTPGAIDRTALLTLEGEKDDITGRGQTHAAQDLCTALPETRKRAVTHPGVGHFGMFNGRRWREEIYPLVRDFIGENA